MKNLNTIEAVEKNAYECMEWMENKIKAVVEKLMEENKARFYDACDRRDCDIELYHYDRGYAEGIHDALVEVLENLEIETDEEYYNP